MKPSYDAVVVGAGPAGCVAAMVLAAAGRSVALVEKERFPRYKTCGGGVVARALASLPCRPPRDGDIPLRAEHRIIVHHPGSAPIVVDRLESPLMLVMRADFDRFLAERAAEAGAERLEGAALHDLTWGRGRYVCRIGDRTIEAAAVVGADGAESRVARFAPGARRGVKLGVALEGEIIPGSGAAIPSDIRAETRFDFGAVPGGYGWVFPKKDHLSVGVFSRQPPFSSLRESYRGYVAKRGLSVEGVTEDRLTGHRIPVRPRHVRGHGGLLLTGDAAGLVDPLTGEGISFAVRSGRAAAEAILSTGRDLRLAAAEYEGLLADVLRELRAARLIASLVYRLPRISFRSLGRHPGFAEAVVDVFLGLLTYTDLLRRVVRRPWRLL